LADLYVTLVSALTVIIPLRLKPKSKAIVELKYLNIFTPLLN
jgi:hypothetical protein